MSTASALEPLRAANLFAEQTLYEFSILSPSRTATFSSLGSGFPAKPVSEVGYDFDIVFVIAGSETARVREPALNAWLSVAASHGVALGGISGGSLVLARAGLMASRRFTVHWHHFAEIEALGNNLLLERGLFVIDRDRFTCAGGTAPLDMMHAIIARDHGSDFANRIGDWFIQPEARQASSPQKTSLQSRYGALHSKVLSALELMETHIADQLSAGQLAALSGISQRQLQRLFNAHFDVSVTDMYRRIRLNKAMELLQMTRLPISEIAHATGFSNQTHFSTCFRRQFSKTPRAARTSGH